MPEIKIEVDTKTADRAVENFKKTVEKLIPEINKRVEESGKAFTSYYKEASRADEETRKTAERLRDTVSEHIGAFSRAQYSLASLNNAIIDLQKRGIREGEKGARVNKAIADTSKVALDITRAVRKEAFRPVDYSNIERATNSVAKANERLKNKVDEAIESVREIEKTIDETDFKASKEGLFLAIGGVLAVSVVEPEIRRGFKQDIERAVNIVRSQIGKRTQRLRQAEEFGITPPRATTGRGAIASQVESISERELTRVERLVDNVSESFKRAQESTRGFARAVSAHSREISRQILRVGKSIALGLAQEIRLVGLAYAEFFTGIASNVGLATVNGIESIIEALSRLGGSVRRIRSEGVPALKAFAKGLSVDLAGAFRIVGKLVEGAISGIALSLRKTSGIFKLVFRGVAAAAEAEFATGVGIRIADKMLEGLSRTLRLKLRGVLGFAVGRGIRSLAPSTVRNFEQFAGFAAEVTAEAFTGTLEFIAEDLDNLSKKVVPLFERGAEGISRAYEVASKTVRRALVSIGFERFAERSVPAHEKAARAIARAYGNASKSIRNSIFFRIIANESGGVGFAEGLQRNFSNALRGISRGAERASRAIRSSFSRIQLGAFAERAQVTAFTVLGERAAERIISGLTSSLGRTKLGSIVKPIISSGIGRAIGEGVSEVATRLLEEDLAESLERLGKSGAEAIRRLLARIRDAVNRFATAAINRFGELRGVLANLFVQGRAAAEAYFSRVSRFIKTLGGRQGPLGILGSQAGSLQIGAVLDDSLSGVFARLGKGASELGNVFISSDYFGIDQSFVYS